MYCPDCKKEISEGAYCPYCGKKLENGFEFMCNEEDFYADAEDDGARPAADDGGGAGEATDGRRDGDADADVRVRAPRENGPYRGEEVQRVRNTAQSAPQSAGKRRFKFNFSKPLCPVFAFLLLVTMIMPWVELSVSGGGLLNIGESMAIFSIQPTFAEYAEFAAVFAGQYADTLWLINGILLLVTAYFMLAAINILLFGVIGLFGRGRTRYFFARVGGTMYIIGLCVIIAAVFFGGRLVRSYAEGSGLAIGLGLTFWPIAALVLALLFRIFGIRLLRYFNGISCMNRGDRNTAARELGKIHKLQYMKNTPTHRTQQR